MFLTTAATEAPPFDIDAIKELVGGIDPAALVPEMDDVVRTVCTVCRLAILVGPVVLFLMGLAYLLLAPKEANYYFGYRTAFGMGSVSAWRHTQKVAGWLFGGIGLMLTVFMLMIGTTFPGMEAMDMVWQAVYCLIAQLVISLAAVFCVNSVAMFTYNYKGEKRHRSR